MFKLPALPSVQVSEGSVFRRKYTVSPCMIVTSMQLSPSTTVLSGHWPLTSWAMHIGIHWPSPILYSTSTEMHPLYSILNTKDVRTMDSMAVIDTSLHMVLAFVFATVGGLDTDGVDEGKDDGSEDGLFVSAPTVGGLDTDGADEGKDDGSEDGLFVSAPTVGRLDTDGADEGKDDGSEDGLFVSAPSEANASKEDGPEDGLLLDMDGVAEGIDDVLLETEGLIDTEGAPDGADEGAPDGADEGGSDASDSSTNTMVPVVASGAKTSCSPMIVFSARSSSETYSPLGPYPHAFAVLTMGLAASQGMTVEKLSPGSIPFFRIVGDKDGCLVGELEGDLLGASEAPIKSCKRPSL